MSFFYTSLMRIAVLKLYSYLQDLALFIRTRQHTFCLGFLFPFALCCCFCLLTSALKIIVIYILRSHLLNNLSIKNEIHVEKNHLYIFISCSLLLANTVFSEACQVLSLGGEREGWVHLKFSNCISLQ